MSEINEPKRSEVIAMALSDDIPFSAIKRRFGLSEPKVKAYMKQWLRPQSYRAWRKRVGKFRAQRLAYKV